jgi:hypothetical protein
MATVIPKLPDRDDQGNADYLPEDGHLGDGPLGEAGEQKQEPDPVDHAVIVTHLRREYKPFR